MEPVYLISGRGRSPGNQTTRQKRASEQWHDPVRGARTFSSQVEYGLRTVLFLDDDLRSVAQEVLDSFARAK